MLQSPRALNAPQHILLLAMRFSQAILTISNDGNVGVYVAEDETIAPNTIVLLTDRRKYPHRFGRHVFYTDGICLNAFRQAWKDDATAAEAFINEMEIDL